MQDQHRSTILVVDDDLAARQLLERILKQNYNIITAADGDIAISIIKQSNIDVIISDIKMGKTDGYALLSYVKNNFPDIPVILLTAFGDIDGAMDAIRQGAFDYLAKPYQIETVKELSSKATSQRRLLKEKEQIISNQTQNYRLSSIVGKSASMLEVYKLVARVAPSDVAVLVYGESGTGKELVARAIHAESSRSQKNFTAVNCGAFAEGVLESELFGHEKGAFTGATGHREGLFESSDNGTLFLDEIHAISPKMQTQLLRVLQEGEIRRIGSNKTQQVNVRIIAATNLHLLQLVSEGSFREDLYYRLNVVSINIPPLRLRTEDIPLLIEHFLQRHRKETKKYITITKEALDLLKTYEWPGNVRELENTIARAVVLSHTGILLESDFPFFIDELHHNGMDRDNNDIIDIKNDDSAFFSVNDKPTLDVLNKRYANWILKNENGNKSKTATILGIDRKTLYRLIDS